MTDKNFNISSRKDRKGEKRTVKMQGDLSLRNARSIRDSLKKLSLAEPSLEVHLEQVEQLDLTVIQLIMALQAKARSKGVEVQVKSTLPEDLLRIVNSAGFGNILETNKQS